jgi:RimJ/RimL family protein N-acetyltransferase
VELPVEIIDGPEVRLRPPRESDADQVAAACADPLTQRFLPMLPDPYTREDALWWINVGSASSRAAGGASYVVVDPATDRVLGGTGINRVIGERAQGEVGYWIAPWARGRGVATAATVALSTWAFRRGFARLELLTERENTASQRVALNAGYQREGVRRLAGAGRAGSRHDLVAWARLVDDPPGPTPRILPDLPAGVLSDGTVSLRPLRTEDTDEVYALRTDPDVVLRSTPPFTPSRNDVAERCAIAGCRWLAGDLVDLTIRAPEGPLAGQIALFHIEHGLGQASVGYDLLPAYRGRGYATRAVRLLAGWAFTHAGIDRLVAGTAPDNVASQRVLERAGFQREGLQRRRLPAAGGDRQDDVLFGLVPGDSYAAVPSASTP